MSKSVRRILILQTARFGDVLLTIPALRALRRQFPEAEIHLVVRRRFRWATWSCDVVDAVWPMDTAQLIGPLMENGDSRALNRALNEIQDWVEALANCHFTDIFNLSFSPSSSYLASLVANSESRIFGYTRNADGTLQIPDDASAYFYAQVGIDRVNRYHLVHVNAAVLGADLLPEDFSIESAATANNPRAEGKILIHVGASDPRKTLSPMGWCQLIKGLLAKSSAPVALIGSVEEIGVAKEIEKQLVGENSRLENLVGRTQWPDLHREVRQARLLIGADSAPLHVAMLEGCPCVNVSFPTVSFWETGPWSDGSWVVPVVGTDSASVEKVLTAVLNKLAKQPPPEGVFVRSGFGAVGYRSESGSSLNADFSWQLVLAIYTGAEFPFVSQPETLRALISLRDAIDLACEQFARLRKNPRDRQASELLDQVDIAFAAIMNRAPELRPLLNWFNTERIRVPAGDVPQVLSLTAAIFATLDRILSVYLGPNERQISAEGSQGVQT